MAVTGQIRFQPRDGIVSIFTTFLDCKVFDHFITMWSPGGAKMTPPLAKWYNGEYNCWEWGTKFDSLRKEKKAKVYIALKT